MKTKSRRAAVDPITLTVLVVIGLGTAVPASRPWNWFKKGPAEQSNIEAEKLKKLEAERAAAQAKADALQAEKDAALRRVQEQKDNQLVQAHEMTYGAAQSLSRVTNPTTEVRTASTMLQHALVYQSMALGDLTVAQKQEVIRLIDLAAAGKEAEFRDLLSKKDAEVKAMEKDKLAAQEAARAAATELSTTKNRVGALTSELDASANRVVELTGKASTEEKKANSFSTQLQRVIRWVTYAAIAYVLCVYVLPVFSMAFPSLKGLGQISGWLAAPFHQMDARKKELLAVDMVGAHEDAKKWIEEKFGREARDSYKKEVLGQWATAHDGTAHLVSTLRNSKLLKKRSQT